MSVSTSTNCKSTVEKKFGPIVGVAPFFASFFGAKSRNLPYFSQLESIFDSFSGNSLHRIVGEQLGNNFLIIL